MVPQTSLRTASQTNVSTCLHCTRHTLDYRASQTEQRGRRAEFQKDTQRVVPQEELRLFWLFLLWQARMSHSSWTQIQVTKCGGVWDQHVLLSQLLPTNLGQMGNLSAFCDTVHWFLNVLLDSSWDFLCFNVSLCTLSLSTQIVECIPVFGFESKSGMWMCWFVCHAPEGKHTLIVSLSNKLKVLKIFFQMKDARVKKAWFIFIFFSIIIIFLSVPEFCVQQRTALLQLYTVNEINAMKDLCMWKWKVVNKSCSIGRIRWSLLIKSLGACNFRLPETFHTHENKETQWWGFPSVLCRILDLQMQPSATGLLENVCQQQYEAQRESWHNVCGVSGLIFRAFMLVVITSTKCQQCI